MLPARVSGHQETPPAEGWAGTDGCWASATQWGQDLAEPPTLTIRASKMAQTSAFYSWTLWTPGVYRAGLEKSGAQISWLLVALPVSMWGMNERTRGAPVCSTAISRRETRPSLCSTWCSAAPGTGPSPGWMDLSLVLSILPPVDPPGLLLLLWASPKLQLAKHSAGRRGLGEVILQ